MQSSHKIEDIFKRMERSILKDDFFTRINEFERKLNETKKVLDERTFTMFAHQGKLYSLDTEQKQIRADLKAIASK